VKINYSNGAPSLADKKGAVSVAHSTSLKNGTPLKGFFDVVFNQNVTACAAAVSAEPGASFSAKAIILERELYQDPPFSQNTRFVVVVFDEDESFIDENFNIIVTC